MVVTASFLVQINAVNYDYDLLLLAVGSRV